MKKLHLLIAVIALAVGLHLYIDRPVHWVYDETKLHEIAQKGIQTAKEKHGEALEPRLIIEEVIRGVLEAYPTTTRYSGRWLWNVAGGAMGAMTVLHCSFSEYLIIFGTAVGTEGHTGRHLADDYFMILYGEQWAALPEGDATRREVYRAGDSHHLPRGVAKQYRMPNACFALEYARGNIVSMLFFGFADSFFSTLDLVTIQQTLYESASNLLFNLLRGKI
ncbi:unnamed protein product [Phytomonas sp. EM1]|nr:unnamed protein product [Phytomonas sp. EM1]|eukprot:CCW59711.1 unnamed protein product [Phytomonas sp. isolate EM1]